MRKAIVKPDRQLAAAVELWKEETEIRAELAQEAFDHQDDDTKEVIERIRDVLRLGASGYIRVRLSDGSSVPVMVEREYLDYNILYVAVEILKDLAFLDVRVANYEFPPLTCTNCGAGIEKKGRK